MEGKSGGHVVLPIEDDSLVVFIDNHSYLLAFPILCRNVDVLLFPVVVKFELDLF